MSAKTRRIRELQAQRELVEQERLLAETRIAEQAVRHVRNAVAMESWSGGTFDVVDRRDYLPEFFGGGYSNLTYSHLDDRREGRNSPFMEHEHDVAMARGMARMLTSVNCPGVGIGENLKNYVIRTGYKFTVGTKKKRQAPAGLVEAVQDVVDEFLDDNDFTGDLDRELFWRGHRDGEFFLALYATRGGKTKARVIEPEQVTDPGGDPFGPEYLAEQYGVAPNCATNWRFGVHKADHDVQQVYGYHVRWAADEVADYLPASMVEHHKENVDRNIARGLTDFYPAWKWLLQHERLLTNTGEGASEQAAIAYIIQHVKGIAKDDVQRLRDGQADRTYTTRTADGGTKTHRVHHRDPGTKLDVPNGQEYLPGPMGAERGNAFLDVANGLLRIVGSRWSMPEYMIAGDASNANFASTVEAGTPFHNACLTMQGRTKMRFTRIAWKAVNNAWRAGRFDRFGLTLKELTHLIEIQVEAPDIESKDPLQQTQRRQLLHAAGVLSVKTWQSQEGLDPELEAANGATAAFDPSMNAAPADGQAAASSAPLGEFGDKSRLQWKRNIRAIKDVLGEVAAGETSEAMGKEMLMSLGLPEARAERLLADAKDNGKVDDPELQEPPAAESLAPHERLRQAAELLWKDYP